jgi:hypothetical protein
MAAIAQGFSKRGPILFLGACVRFSGAPLHPDRRRVPLFAASNALPKRANSSADKYRSILCSAKRFGGSAGMKPLSNMALLTLLRRMNSGRGREMGRRC